MNFSLNDMGRFVKPCSFMLLSLKVVRWDFQVENYLGVGALSII